MHERYLSSLLAKGAALIGRSSFLQLIVYFSIGALKYDCTCDTVIRRVIRACWKI